MTSTDTHPQPAVALAMVKAGLRGPSQMRQIWQWVKDHPRVLSKDIAATLPISVASMSSVLAQMVARKMILAKKEWSDHAKRDLLYYTAIGREYELLPDTRVRPTLVPPVVATLVPPVVKASVPAPAPACSAIQEMTDRLTIGEARAVYEVLHLMFGKA